MTHFILDGTGVVEGKNSSKEEVLKTIIVFVFATGHVVITGMYNYLLVVPILSSCPQQEFHGSLPGG